LEKAGSAHVVIPIAKYEPQAIRRAGEIIETFCG
jgi:hypothetical protein